MGRLLVAGLAACLLLGGCVTPATGVDSYQGKATESLGAANSEVSAAQIVVRLVLDDRVLHTYADQVLSENEQTLDSVSGTFVAVQPPPDADATYRQTSALLERAASLVRNCRIAVRRSDVDALAHLEPRLGSMSRRLQAAEAKLS
jgi:hypothetical protein